MNLNLGKNFMNMCSYKFLIEVLSVGILVVIVGTLVSYSISKTLYKNKKIQNDWNKYYIMEIALFITGVFVHIICELFGINKWYCNNGNACFKK